MSDSHTIDVDEAESRFSELLHIVEAGAEVVVTRSGTPVARFVPVVPKSRVADSRGMFPGRFNLPDDFEDDGAEMGDLFGIGPRA